MFASTGVLAAVEFCIENEVRLGNNYDKQSKPVKSSAYLLNGDFISIIGENGEITVFDSRNQHFTLLDPVLRIQTQIDADETKKQILFKQEQILARSETGSFLAFAAKPQFPQHEYDAVSGDIGLQSPWVDYTLKTAALPNEEAAKQYADFCDWNCFLNLRLNPHSGLMFVRLEVNRILREKSRCAVGVSVSFYPKGKGLLAKPELTQSTHTLVMRLDDTAKKRLAQVSEFKRTFQQVSFEEYQRRAAEKTM